MQREELDGLLNWAKLNLPANNVIPIRVSLLWTILQEHQRWGEVIASGTVPEQEQQYSKEMGYGHHGDCEEG